MKFAKKRQTPNILIGGLINMYINNDPLQPDTLEEILALRPEGADVAPKKVDNLENRMKGAVIGRFAGCILGVPVEMYPIAKMQAVALESGNASAGCVPSLEKMLGSGIVKLIFFLLKNLFIVELFLHLKKVSSEKRNNFSDIFLKIEENGKVN